MTDQDDWEPLRSDQVAAHPGEFVVVQPRTAIVPVAAAPVPVEAPAGAAPEVDDDLPFPTVPSAAPKVRRTTPPDPEAEKALQALKDKIARRPAAQSLIAQVQKREEKRARKEERKHRAAEAPELAAVVPVRLPVVAPNPPGEPAGDWEGQPAGQPAAQPAVPLAGEPGPSEELLLRDPREDETWFRGLPEAEQQRLVAAWSLRRERMKLDRPGQLRLRRDRFVSALLVFATVWLLGSGSYWLATVGSAILTGIAWQNLPACRFRDPILACVVYGLCQALAFLVSTDTVMHPGLVNDVLLLVPIAGLLGFSGEMRRTGGFDAD